MKIFLYIVLSSFLISLGSLAGMLTLSINEKRLKKFLLQLVSLSAGAMIGSAFIHLLPEAAESLPSEKLNLCVLASFVAFFLIEKVLHWKHHNKGKEEIKSFGVMNLFADAVHNFTDGLVIAATFVVDIKLGVITSIAIALHEIPQEIGDFGVLLYAGYEKKKALWANFLVALTVILGGIVGFFLVKVSSSFIPYLLPFAAGGFIYIGASDLLPEVKKEKNGRKSALSFVTFVIGILLMFLIKFVE